MTSHVSQVRSRGGSAGYLKPGVLAGGLEHLSDSITLEGTLLAAGRARHFVERALCPIHAGAATSAVTLATSELVTRAVLGGSGPVTVTLACQVTTVAIAVTRGGDETPYHASRQLGDEVAARIIEGISRASGHDTVDGRPRTWCIVPTGFVPAPPAAAR